MPIWTYWAASILLVDLLIVAFVRGADRRRNRD